jgi:predicted nucleic acid-binding protein
VIVLDTNVIFELTRQSPMAGVVSWLDALSAAQVSTTAITAADPSVRPTHRSRPSA